MKTKLKEHRFTLLVKTSGTRENAELAVLSAFASRKPDNCSFYLKHPASSIWSIGGKRVISKH